MVAFVEERRIVIVVNEGKGFQPLCNRILLLLLLTVFQGLPSVDVLFSHEIRCHEQMLVDLDIQDMCIDKSLAEI